MKDNLLNFVSVVAALLIIAICASLFSKFINEQKDAGLRAPQPSPQQALDKYSFGECETEADCAPAGCSGEVCSSDSTLITTCELRPDAPDTGVFTCGCVDQKCVWYK